MRVRNLSGWNLRKIKNKSIVIFLFEGEQIDLLSKNRPDKKGGVAYLCINHSCLPPIYSGKELLSYFEREMLTIG